MKLNFNGAGKACYRFADPVVSEWLQYWSLLHTKLVLWFCRWHVYVKRRCQILYTGQYINDLLTYSKYFMYVFLISIWKAIYIFRCVFYIFRFSKLLSLSCWTLFLYLSLLSNSLPPVLPDLIQVPSSYPRAFHQGRHVVRPWKVQLSQSLLTLMTVTFFWSWLQQQLVGLLYLLVNRVAIPGSSSNGVGSILAPLHL